MIKKHFHFGIVLIVMAGAALACGTKNESTPTVPPPPPPTQAPTNVPEVKPTEPQPPKATPTVEWTSPEGLDGWTQADVQKAADSLRNSSDEELAELLVDMNEIEIAEMDALLTYLDDQELTDRVLGIYQTVLNPGAGSEPWRMAQMDGSELLLSVKDDEVPPDWMDIVSYHAKAQALPPGYYVEIHSLPTGTKLKAVRDHYINVAGEQGMKKARDEEFQAGDGLVTWLDPTAKSKKYSIYFNPGNPQPWVIVFYSKPEL